MSKFESRFAPYIDGMLSWRETFGHSRSSYEGMLLNFDRFCALHSPEETMLTKDMVLKWMEKRPTENTSGSLMSRASAIRCFAEYLVIQGVPAYVLPAKFVGGSSSFTPYIFTDSELEKFFKASDHIQPKAYSSDLPFDLYLRIKTK